MKVFIYALIISSCACFMASAQSSINMQNMPRRSIRFRYINKDSVNLALNENFELIEDSCAQITRYAHLHPKERTFFGAFKDVSRLNNNLVLAEGRYSDDGRKDGSFITRYLNGNLQAKGNFKNNNYDGNWEIYYDNSKPRLMFSANEGDIKINNAWDEKDVKIVADGKGAYRVDLGSIYWQGKLLNGKPDGIWHAIKTDDATNTYVVTETYKNGAFKKGSGPGGSYTDAPRLILVPTDMLPFTHTESLRISMVPCNGAKSRHIVGAQYRNGLSSFSQYIGDAVTPYISGIDIKTYENEVTFEGEIDTDGKIINLTSRNPFNDNLARGLIRQLNNLPYLQPATADGKPVKQKFTITFKFSKGMYSFIYNFLPVVVN